jgi:hypothetical protein
MSNCGGRRQSRGHSAHIGQDVVVYYRWHPLCGRAKAAASTFASTRTRLPPPKLILISPLRPDVAARDCEGSSDGGFEISAAGCGPAICTAAKRGTTAAGASIDRACRRGEKKACRNTVAPGDFRNFRARHERFFHKPRLLGGRPPPPPLNAVKNFNPHRSTLKLALRSHAPPKAAAKQGGAGRKGTWEFYRHYDAGNHGRWRSWPHRRRWSSRSARGLLGWWRRKQKTSAVLAAA